MAYSLSTIVDAGTASLTLKASLAAAGTIHATLRDITAGITDYGQGYYEFVSASIPDGYRGAVFFHTGDVGVGSDFSAVVIYAVASINPQEIENTDVKSSTLATAATLTDVKTKTDFLPSATAGAAGGLFIAGANAATSITTALTANIVGNVTGNLSGSVGSVTGAVGSVTGAVGSVTGSVGSVTGAVGSVTGNVGGSVAGSVGSVSGAVGSVTGAVGSVTGNVGGNVTGSVGSVAAGGITAASIATGALDADSIAADALTAIADAILKRDFSAITGESARSLLNAARFLRNKWSVSGTTLTVTKEDDATSAWTSALSTDAAADPITGSDPG